MTFTLDEIMEALGEAFANTHPRTWRDCDIENALKEALIRRANLSARPEVNPKSTLEREE